MIHLISSFSSTTPLLTPRRFAYTKFFDEYCYLKQRNFEVHTGSDMFGQVRKNSIIFEPRTAPGVRSGPLPMLEPELRFGSGSVQVRNRFWTGQRQHYSVDLCSYFAHQGLGRARHRKNLQRPAYWKNSVSRQNLGATMTEMQSQVVKASQNKVQ
jgi:hypothetical protein